MRNWKIGFVCALISFVLVIVCLFGIWYTISMEGSSMGITMKGDIDFGLREATMTAEAAGMTISNTTAYSDVEGDQPTIKVYNTTQILVILALIFTLLMLVFALLVGKGKVSSKVGVVFGVLAIVFTLIPFIYFMAALPAAMEEESFPGTPVLTGFWGSDTLELSGFSYDMTWGPGWAWYVMIVAFILALIGSVMLIGAGPAVEAIAPPPEEAPPLEEPPVGELEPPLEAPPEEPPEMEIPPPP